MFENEAELAETQALLDASLAGASGHLQSIIRAGERTLTARQLVNECQGMCTLALATVTARGEPRISGGDGHFLHGRWVIGTSRSAAKARHLAARPAISAAYMIGEELGVFTHGRAVTLNPPDEPEDPAWPEVSGYLRTFYGDDAGFDWGEVVFYRIEPHWMVAWSSDPSKVAG